MATKKRSKKKPDKTRPSHDARKPKPTTKKPARQPAAPRRSAAVKASEPAAAKAARKPALLILTATGLGALRAAIDASAQRSGTRKRGVAAAKRDESLSDALDRLDADYARLLR